MLYVEMNDGCDDVVDVEYIAGVRKADLLPAASDKEKRRNSTTTQEGRGDDRGDKVADGLRG